MAVSTRPELVIFDCDGVLVDSEPISHRVLAMQVAALGLAITPEDSHDRYRGMQFDDIGEDLERQLGAPLPTDFWDRFRGERALAFEDSLQAVPGARETVAAIQAAGIRTCVATQACIDKTYLTLGLTGLRAHFADGELFSAYGVARGKPFPDVFLHAAARMGVPPQACLVVEDSLVGIQAALAAGMRVIAYAPSGLEPSELFELNDRITAIARLTELIPMLTS